MQRRTAEKIYAGVLGKITGVFYGRPIEGWPYEKIRETFDIVDHYVYQEAGTPLIVADDDVAGTFTFLNAVEDCENIRTLASQDFGEMWLDYLIENKTIFWWGGLGRSTEHTAYMRLKQGISAPKSGSIEVNGKAVAEQIGAQIFMDALAMMCPNDPEMARKLVRASASVSHDGIAVEAACFLATLESLAFEERNIDKLLDAAVQMGVSERLGKIIEDVRQECRLENDFRIVRDWLDEHYGYHLYPGNCHVIPNFALILMSLILGGDDFCKAMQICISCGWDTDCNGANLGCLNGIRLGLDSLSESFDFRGPVADRLYNISSNGGECVSDAVLQARRIIAASDRLYGTNGTGKLPRFAFEFPGSVQGFCGCPYLERETFQVRNSNIEGNGNGILIRSDRESCAVSTPVMFVPDDRQQNYCLTASPVLYESQTVHAAFETSDVNTEIQLYIAYFDFNNQIRFQYSSSQKTDDRDELGKDETLAKWICDCQENGRLKLSVEWKIPDLGGMPIARIGVLCKANNGGKINVILREIDWDGAPEHFEIRGSLRNYDIGLNMAMESFVSSARQFHFDARASFTVSHTEKNGVATIGTAQWRDYKVKSCMDPSIHSRFGIVGRARGHRRYYALVLWEHKYAGIICKQGKRETCLIQIPFVYEENKKYQLELSMCGNQITGCVDGMTMQVCDDTYSEGGAGFVVDEGTVLAYGFVAEAIK
jgi:ADP-ribosylglycohydrolase